MTASRPVKTPQQAAANWKSAMSSPQTSTKYQQGVQAVTVAPNSLAAAPAAVAKYSAKTQDAANSGRLAAANNAVPLEAWRAAAVAGAASLSIGAARGAARQAAAAQKMHSAWQQARDQAAAIPNDGSEANIAAKVLASVRAMRQGAGKMSS